MKLKGPENCGGMSHEGVEFTPDADGCIEIPDENTDAIVAAFSHGFSQVVTQQAPVIEEATVEPQDSPVEPSQAGGEGEGQHAAVEPLGAAAEPLKAKRKG